MSINLTRVSKTISYLLRHGAIKENIPIDQEGYVLVTDLLKHDQLKGVNLDIVKNIVENDNKQRYNLVVKNNQHYIRANQGHSIEVKNLELEEIKQVDQCIHGTYYEAWKLIKNEGLNKMSRNHIHFTTDLPNSGTVISGMRSNCQIAIYVDITKCINDGIKFYKSQNGVILSPGDSNGTILPKYFLKVVDTKTKKDILKC